MTLKEKKKNEENDKARLLAKEGEPLVINDPPYILLKEPTSRRLYNFVVHYESGVNAVCKPL